jgi:hypothetical protein
MKNKEEGCCSPRDRVGGRQVAVQRQGQTQPNKGPSLLKTFSTLQVEENPSRMASRPSCSVHSTSGGS